MTITSRLAELDVTLPDASAPAGNYVPFVVVGDMVYISGQISVGADGPITGKLHSCKSPVVAIWIALLRS
jgi:enamine deaminase RidA (YjgF/YER057c/UK114 family)